MKTLLTIVVTAVVCFGITAAAGLARTSAGHQYNLKVGDRSVFTPGNLQCQVLAKNQAVCGGLKVTNSVVVYYSPTQLAVVKVTSQKKGTLLYQVKR
jgi:hypothetical protein